VVEEHQGDAKLERQTPEGVETRKEIDDSLKKNVSNKIILEKDIKIIGSRLCQTIY
jgi:hypothetical protein